MTSIIFLSVLLFVTTAQANESRSPRRDQFDPETTNDKEDAVAYESFGSPVYGSPKSGGLPPNGKSGYPLPVAPVPSDVPAAYTAYLNSIGYASPYGYGNAYNRYGLMPYAAPYYGYGTYGAPFTAAPGYGYGAAVAPGYGYATGIPYGNSVLGRTSAYNAYGYGGYPGYSGLGYRFGGLGYNAAALRGPAVPAAVNGVPAPIAAVPAPVPSVPGYAVPAVAAPNKGSALQYGYAPAAAQRLY